MTQQPLVNAHTHLELSWMGKWCPEPPGEPFHEWIWNLSRDRSQIDRAERNRRARESSEAAIQTLIDGGTTHIGDISQSGESIEPLLASGLAGVIYLEVIGLKDEQWRDWFAKVQARLDKFRPQERNGLRMGVELHAPYSLPPNAWEELVPFCQREDVPVAIHVAESPFENRELLGDLTGPFTQIARMVGVEPTVPGKRSVDYLESLGVLDLQPLMVHMVDINEAELDKVKAYGCKVAHCPRSNSLLQCGQMPLRAMLDKGIPVAIGTDSLASSPSLDVREEAAAAVAMHAGSVDSAEIDALLHNTAVLT